MTAESPDQTEQVECNQPDCEERFDSVMQMVVHTVNQHGDDDAPEKLIDEIVSRTKENNHA